MSRENVKIIRRGYAHFMATREIRAHPDLVWDVSELGWPDQQVYTGCEGAMQFNAEWAAAWDAWEIEPEDFIDAGERVVVILTQRGRSKATGIPVEMRFAQVWTLRDGQGIRMQMYANVDEALEAVGLSEQGMSQENVEIVRRGIEAVNREDLQGLLDVSDPLIEWWDRTDDPGADVHRGHEGVAEFLTNLFEAAEWHIELEDCIDAGDLVVVTARLVGRGRASGASFDERQTYTYRVRDGLVTEIREYREMSEALEAAGLSEQDAHADS